MTEPAKRHEDAAKPHTTHLGTVIAAERRYLERRRRRNNLPGLAEDKDLWGIAFSGGGVRSATFCLGALQALTRKARMPRFDYLSTVSGGGYIGSCLTSLLSEGRPRPGEKPKTKTKPVTGLDHPHSPFTGLNERQDYADPDHTELSVRHQLHHLRTHGEYLIPRSHLLSRDVQRALGSSISGMAHTIVLFLLLFVTFVAVVHLGLTVIDRDLTTLAPAPELNVPGTEEIGYLEYVQAVLGAWYDQRLRPPIGAIFDGAGRFAWMLLATVVFGFLWCLGWFVHVTRLAHRFEPDTPPGDRTRAGWNAEDERESRLVRRLNLSSMVLAIVMMLGLSLFYRFQKPSDAFLAGLVIPLALALGGLFASHLLTHLAESSYMRKGWKGGKTYESRFRRSLYGSLRGACLYGTAAAALLPFLTVFLFSLADLPLKFFWALAALGSAYYSSRKGGDAATSQLGGWLRRPLANLAVLVFLAFAFAQVSAWLMSLYGVTEQATWLDSLLVAVPVFVVFAFLGLFIDANRVAPHYFYRDRLTEAYLKTDARSCRPPTSSRQGMPLTVLRDNEDLRLSDLGRRNLRGPYHLIVAALNLIGSKELNRKSFLSEHFIFSRYYIGSRVTGWVKTRKYRKNTTRLARAMAISAAAVASAMGRNTFGAQAFVTTLLNARLGYWMENPWFYRDGQPGWRRSLPVFWPYYLMLEIFGLTSARQSRVNLSDGGHTGDNLGLLPLLSRRCSTILVCDAEADGDYSFGSFNNAVRLALTEENVEIDIYLEPVTERQETPGGLLASRRGVVEGKIRYPATTSGEPEFTGKLIYVKASLTHDGIPVHVANYAKKHETFPHETTADQFFDDAQFEAYRALGEHLGEQAADRLEQPAP